VTSSFFVHSSGLGVKFYFKYSSGYCVI